MCTRWGKEQGEAQSQAYSSALDKWCLRPHVLVFYTTASNTDLHHGTCTFIEEGLGRELVWIAFKHYVHETVFASAVRSPFGPTSDPDTVLLNRFRGSWRHMNPGRAEHG